MRRCHKRKRQLQRAIGSALTLGLAIVTLSCAMGSLPAPTGVAGTAADEAVDLAWDAAGDAIGYRVLMHTESGITGTVYTEARETGTTGLRWSGLLNGTTYYFAVAAIGVDGVGPVSGEIDVIPQAPPADDVVHNLDPTTPLADALYGFAVASDGDFAVVGAPGYEVNGFPSGAVFVYRRVDAGWSEPAVLSPESPRGAEQFGFSVDISGDAIVVGAPNWSDSFGEIPGNAQVFERTSGNTWEQVDTLGAGFQTQSGADFGGAVAIDGGYIAVGADAEDAGGATNSGAVYVFRRGTVDWGSGARITISGTPVASDAFGRSVDLDGDYLLVGAPGRDYSSFSNPGTAQVFRRTGENTWDFSDELIASGAFTDTGTSNPDNDRFGDAVAVDGRILVVGVPYDSEFSLRSGAVHVYYRTGEDNYSRGYKLLAPDASYASWFGSSVSISDGLLAVGAMNANLPGYGYAGAAYLYVDEGNGLFVHPTRVQSPTPTARGGFGFSVAVGPGGLLVGEPYAQTDGTDPGDAWVFD